MKKLNWGHGIFIAIAVMIFSLLTLVFFTVNQKIELVTEDYYPKELKYQEEIQKQKQTQQLQGKIEISIDDVVSIQFPS
nr:FixH family protein [Prolixibacteraceae bacterium]